MDTILPLNCIPLKTSEGLLVGVFQYENKLIRNREICEMIVFNDEAVITLVRQISDVIALKLIEI